MSRRPELSRRTVLRGLGTAVALPCSDGTLDKCVDSPNDSCDPANGGADCPGICHQCGDVAFRCTFGTDWLNCKCK